MGGGDGGTLRCFFFPEWGLGSGIVGLDGRARERALGRVDVWRLERKGGAGDWRR